MAGTDQQLLTVAEAAAKLRVSVSTIWRWINTGRLPAYRVGQRRVRIASDELQRLITPARTTQDAGIDEELQREIVRLSRPMTGEEKARALAALRRAQELSAEILASRGLKWFSPSATELLDEIREGRMRELP